jgi:ATP-dependent Lon protease
MPVPDEDLEWMVRLALESRRRVKEQQKRLLKSEFRNTHFSYVMGADGVEQFVATPELHSDEAIESDPLPPGQVWAVSPGGPDSEPGLYRIEATVGPGSTVKILNQPVPPGFRESVRIGEQNLYTRAKELVGDRDPRAHEFSLQLRAMDADKNGAGLGLPVLVAMCGALLGRKIASSTTIGRAATSMRSASRSARQQADVAHAEESLASLEERRRQLEDEVNDELERIRIETAPERLALEEIEIPARKTDIAVDDVVLAWVPS